MIRPVQLLPILLLALPLGACEKAEIDTALANIRGDTPVTPLINLSPPVSQSVEPTVEIAAVTEVSSSSSAYIATAHEVCDPPWIWRGVEQPGACSTSWF